MAQLSSFFDANLVNGVPDRQYDATAWANYFSGFIGNGVSNSPANTLQVTAGTGLQVIINNGIGYINGYYYNNTEPLTVNINTANATYPRIDSIIIELNLNNREIISKTLMGTAQTNPTAPNLSNTDSLYQLQLATVYVPAGATNVGAITDTRANSNVCGWVNVLVPTPPPPIITNASITDGVIVQEDGGSINYNNQNGTNIINVCVNADTFDFTNSQTNNNIFSVTPVTSGTDTVSIDAMINFNSAGGVNFLTPLTNENIGLCTYSENGQEYVGLYDNTSNMGLMYYDVTNKQVSISDLLNINALNVNGAVALNNIVTARGGNAGFNLETQDGKYTISASPTGTGNFYICDNTNGNTIALYNPVTQALTLYDTTLNGTVAVNSSLIVQNQSGEIFFQNAQNQNMVAFNPDNATFQFKNAITNNNIIAVTPVSTGTDTVNIDANLNISTTGNVNYENNKGTSIVQVAVEEDVFYISNAITNNEMIFVTPVASGTDTLQIGALTNFSENMIIENENLIEFQNSNSASMISIGTLNNQFVLSNTITGNPLFSLTPVSSGIDNVNVESNVTFMQPIDLESGLQAQGQDVVTVFPAIQGTTYVTGSAEVSYYAQMWALEGGLLTVGNQNDIKLGILRVVVTPSTSFTWENGQTITINCSEIPNLHGAPLQVATMNGANWWEADPFVCSVNEGNLLLTGSPNSWNLNAGQNYTNYALVFIETT